jgi:site-specific DNA recombinase
MKSKFLDIAGDAADTGASAASAPHDPDAIRADSIGGGATAHRLRYRGADSSSADSQPPRRLEQAPGASASSTRRSVVKSVALYARVSSEQQAQQATVASQIAALEERAKSDGCIVLPSDLFVDEGYSGASLARPALERLRDRAAEGGLDVLYVHSPDRLARRYAYQVLLIEELTRHGVAVVFLNGPSGRSAEDELLVQVQGMIAEYERAKILERCRRGKLHKARTGVVNPLSGAPYGYLYVRKTDDEPASYQVLLHEAKVVRSIFQWLVEEQVSIGEITRRLRDQGTLTRTGLPRWDRATVWGILRNPAYAGKAAFGKTEAITRGKLLRPIRGKATVPKHAKSAHRDKSPSEWLSIPVPAIISPDTFAAAHEQLERNRRLSARNARGQRYLLQGLVVCARCGYAFYGKPVSRTSMKGTIRYAYYRCVGSDAHRFAGGRVCNNPQVRVDQLDGYVWDSVCGVLKDPARVLEEWSRRGASDGTVGELRTQRDEAKRMLAAQEQTLQRLRDAYEAGALELDDLVARSERVRARLRRAQEELQQVESALTKTVELTAVIGRMKDFAERVQHGLEKLDWSQRRQLIRTLVARVEIGEQEATVVYRVPTAPSGEGGPTVPRGGHDQGDEGGGDESCQLRGRRDHATLRCPFFGVREVRSLEHPRVQPLADQTHQHSVTYPSTKDVQQVAMVDGVEELLDVDLKDPATTHPHRRVLQRLARLVRRATGPEAVRDVQKRRLVDGLERHRHGALQHLVLEGGNADGARLRPIALRDVHPSHRRRSVHARLRAVQERPKVVLQLLRVLLRTLSVHAPSSVFPGAPVGFAQPFDVDVMGQRRKSNAGHRLRHVRYLFEFR